MIQTDENIPLVPKWTIGVVTRGFTQYADLKNALLYADRVEWLDFENCIALLRATTVVISNEGRGIANAHPLLSIYSEAELSAKNNFENDLDVSGLRSAITASWGVEQISARLGEGWSDVSALASMHDDPAFLEMIRKTHSEQQIKFIQSRSADPIRNWLDIFMMQLEADLREAATRSTVFINPGALRPPAWNAHVRANLLMKALSRLLLPDVGELPIEAIAELREKLRDKLDPMRAEMLRLSEDLRKLGATPGEEDLLRESEELIATRVEPIIRMASAKAREFTKNKWRKFYVGLAKTFGFAGAGFLSPALLTKALEEVLNTGASIADMKESSNEPYKASAAFVIEARRAIAEHRC